MENFLRYKKVFDEMSDELKNSKFTGDSSKFDKMIEDFKPEDYELPDDYEEPDDYIGYWE